MTNSVFFAGQKKNKYVKGSLILSPIPVKTNVPIYSNEDIIMNKDDVTLEIGGTSGIIFHTQLNYFLFIFAALFCCLLPLYFFGGISGIVDSSIHTEFINGGYERKFSLYDFIGFFLFCFGPFTVFTSISLYNIFSFHIMSRRILPIRFNRQRREVIFSIWNKETKSTEYRFFPWERVCALVGGQTFLSTAGVATSSGLLIGVSDEQNEEQMWSGMSFSAISELHAAGMWEMIRCFMEEPNGYKKIGNPRPYTLDGLIEEYCQSQNIDKKNFPLSTKIWWMLNGTYLGVLRIKWEQKSMMNRAVKFPEIIEWSKPIPESEWAKPSEELCYYNRMLEQNDYAMGDTIFNVGDLREKYRYKAKS